MPTLWLSGDYSTLQPTRPMAEMYAEDEPMARARSQFEAVRIYF